MEIAKRLKYWTTERVEVLLLALTLLATVIISWLTLRQTTRHFRIERTSSFVARFNSQEMVGLREDVDRWLDTHESPKDLYERSIAKDASGRSIAPVPGSSADHALNVVSKLITLANYFQEFGTALKVGSLDERYAHDLLGAVCIRYAIALEPFIVETRLRRQQPQAYEEVFLLKARMEALDAK